MLVFFMLHKVSKRRVLKSQSQMGMMTALCLLDRCLILATGLEEQSGGIGYRLQRNATRALR